MPLRAELIDHLGFDAVLDKNATEVAAPQSKSWLGKCGLNVHAVIHKVRHELRMRERLVEASHDAEAYVSVVPLHECRNDRMEWPLVSREDIWVCGVERK